ncbi:lipoprotein [Acinetobacter sp. ABJ_C5_2]
MWRRSFILLLGIVFALAGCNRD